ncbi:MAG: hypothetical protein AABZ74_08875 [Cyanobacteriota bacterium]
MSGIGSNYTPTYLNTSVMATSFTDKVKKIEQKQGDVKLTKSEFQDLAKEIKGGEKSLLGMIDKLDTTGTLKQLVSSLDKKGVTITPQQKTELLSILGKVQPEPIPRKELFGMVKEIEGLKGKVSSLQTDIREFKNDIRNLPTNDPKFSQKMLELEGKISKLESKLVEKKDKLSKLEDKFNKSPKDEITTLMLDAGIKPEELKPVEIKRTAWERVKRWANIAFGKPDVASSAISGAAFVTTKSLLQSGLETAGNVAGTVGSSITIAGGAIMTSKSIYDTGSAIALKSRANDFLNPEETLKKLETKKMPEVKEKIDGLEKKITGYKNDIREFKNDIRNLPTNDPKFSQKMLELEGKISKLEGKILEKSSKLDTLKVKLASYESRKEAIKGGVSEEMKAVTTNVIDNTDIKRKAAGIVKGGLMIASGAVVVASGVALLANPVGLGLAVGAGVIAVGCMAYKIHQENQKENNVAMLRGQKNAIDNALKNPQLPQDKKEKLELALSKINLEMIKTDPAHATKYLQETLTQKPKDSVEYKQAVMFCEKVLKVDPQKLVDGFEKTKESPLYNGGTENYQASEATRRGSIMGNLQPIRA